MAREMLINVSEGEECRIALLENSKLQEFYIERTSATSHVGNIYRGKVVNVEPSIQAAFIDFGLGRNGFLHISDLLPSYFGRQGEEMTETVGRKLARRDRPPIQRCLRRGDDIIVQIIKEGIGTKGPTLTTYLSVPGRILVMMPGMSKMGVSRKIEDDGERRRLRQILDSLDPIEQCGFIIRTAGVGKTKAEIQRDLAYLTRLWQQVDKKLRSSSGSMELYTEGDLVTRTVRDVISSEIDAIIVDNEKVVERLRDYIKLTSPRAKDKVQLYDGALPIFHKYNIEREIEMMYSRHVPLPSGGSLVIDQTEAVVAIDVNSGKFRDHSDAETTAFKTDMEAADEIPRQLKLRDLGGVIICDFIDLRFERHRRELEGRLHGNFQNDRAKTKVLRMSQFGIIEITRQRMRPSLKRSIYCDCASCRGSGLVKTPESMSLDVMRKLAVATHDARVTRITLTVHGQVAEYLGNRKRRQLAELEGESGKRIIIRADMSLGLDEVRLELMDSRDGLVSIPEVLASAPQTLQEAQLMAVQARNQGPAASRERGHDRPQRGDHRSQFEAPDEPFDIDDELDEPSSEHPDNEREPDTFDEDDTGEVAIAPAAKKNIEAETDVESEPSDAVGTEDHVEESDQGHGDTQDIEEESEPMSNEIEPQEQAVGEEDYDRRPSRGGHRDRGGRQQGGRDQRGGQRGDQRGGQRNDQRGTGDQRSDQRGTGDQRGGGRRDDRGFDQRDNRDQRGGRQQQGGQQPQRDQRSQSPQPQPQRAQQPPRPPQPMPQPPRPPQMPAPQQNRPEPQRPAARPAQPSQPMYQSGDHGDRDHDQAGRGRSGFRGRGRFQQPSTPVNSNASKIPPARSQEELLRRMPTNIWIQMPGAEDSPTPATAPTAAPIAESKVPQIPPAMPRPVVARPAPVATPTPPPAPVPSERPAVIVKAAPIAEWPQAAPVRKRPAKPAPAAEAEESKSGKAGAKKTTRKAKAPAVAKAKVSRSRSKKKAGDDTPQEEPRVRIADAVSVTKSGDRHLATDEPVDPEAIRKVSVARDLDHIPEEE